MSDAHDEAAKDIVNTMDLHGYAIGVKDGKQVAEDRRKLFDAIAAALRKAAADEREACATKAANHYIGSTFPGDYRYCCDIEAEIRARAKGGA